MFVEHRLDVVVCVDKLLHKGLVVMVGGGGGGFYKLVVKNCNF